MGGDVRGCAGGRGVLHRTVTSPFSRRARLLLLLLVPSEPTDPPPLRAWCPQRRERARA